MILWHATRYKSRKKSLRHLAKYLQNYTIQLVEGFRTESSKVGYVRNALLGKKWASSTLNNISAARYTFDQHIVALNGGIQLDRKIEKAKNPSKTYYGQFTTLRKDVC